jgi:hypothetical protein
MFVIVGIASLSDISLLPLYVHVPTQQCRRMSATLIGPAGLSPNRTEDVAALLPPDAATVVPAGGERTERTTAMIPMLTPVKPLG